MKKKRKPEIEQNNILIINAIDCINNINEIKRKKRKRK